MNFHFCQIFDDQHLGLVQMRTQVDASQCKSWLVFSFEHLLASTSGYLHGLASTLDMLKFFRKLMQSRKLCFERRASTCKLTCINLRSRLNGALNCSFAYICKITPWFIVLSRSSVINYKCIGFYRLESSMHSHCRAFPQRSYLPL